MCICMIRLQCHNYFQWPQRAERVSESAENKACPEEFIPEGPVGDMIRSLRQVCM